MTGTECPNLVKRELIRIERDLHPDWSELFTIDHVSRMLSNAHGSR
jgi:hypothetical protein